ncbi:hypothetical protein A1O3_07162 [Capronia epimyces CBS 606.96]|uniref:Xylanolytic transcriptional activator regulatory domain-containing protein n=1 Tax=Capronia epimyces CBS 606.96 TaxID=1182542 RepID=W9XU88_9EURO|nr:uncharacterized protein A1O3_07162 [Capronia epimyces CBS 606.96]EXJ80875.1 hypothetical protein A1O3_07162 [Capronia epimyces CBS 606.96]
MGKDHRSLRALASLLEEYATVWQGSSPFDTLADGAETEFFQFEEDQVRVWLDVFVATLQQERLLLTSAPAAVLDHLAASQPHQVPDRAWLVMFYSVVLGTRPADEPIKAKLRSNLWLAFNDVRLLLEPTASSVQALVILACHVEEFMTPSLCWALISRACIMLQALGISPWQLDPPTRERRATSFGRLNALDQSWRLDSPTLEGRTMLFWRLNVLDQSLALILGKPPTFHREITVGMTPPTLDKLLPSQSQYPSSGAPVLFNAHYTHQMHLLSRVMSDVWHCLHGQGSDDVHTVIETVESWHRQAREVLEAAALAEKPLLGANGVDSVDLGLQMLCFHYSSLVVLLKVSSRSLRAQCIDPSQQMLRLLPRLGDMGPSLKEPYTCILWQPLQCPLTAFGTLWGEIVTKGKTQLEQNKQFLADIEHVPAFMGKLSSRNPLAAKLANITERFVQQARSILYSEGQCSQENEAQHSNPPMAFMNAMPSTNMSNASQGQDLDAQLDDLFPWADDRFFDATFDWFAWTNQELS